MSFEDRTIGFIGAGSMGGAMIAAIATSKLVPPDRILATDLNPQRLTALHQGYGIVPVERNDTLFNDSDIIVVAVKPQQLDELFKGLAARMPRPISRRRLLISIAAGYPIRRIESWLYADLEAEGRAMLPIVRVMPNTPALVSAGMAGFCPNTHADPTDLAQTRALLETMGRALQFAEPQLHAVTALSGSGPAYVFYLAESMIAAGIELGLSEEHSLQLTLATLEGAAKLLVQSEESPGQVRRGVTSPGGTTEAAFRVLADGGVKQAVIAAIKAAAQRSEELGGQFKSV